MTALSEDARLLLAVFAAATDPLDWSDVVEQLADGPESLFAGARDQQQFYRTRLARWNYLTAEVMLLFRDGLLVEVEDAAVDMTVITEAGRAALLTSAQRAERKAQDALGAAHREAATALASLDKPSGPEGAL